MLRRSAYEAMRILLSCLLILALVPGWSGEQRLPLFEGRPQMDVHRVDLDPRDPSRRRLGALTYLGGIVLTSRLPAFGGYSSLAVAGDRFLLLSDGGNIVRFRMGADWTPHDLQFSNLPSGPGTGWEKRDRDSESLAVDPKTGQLWVGFEGYNQIWRYAPGFTRAEGYVVPKDMRRWPKTAGPSRWRVCPTDDSSPFPKRRRSGANPGAAARIAPQQPPGADLPGRSLKAMPVASPIGCRRNMTSPMPPRCPMARWSWSNGVSGCPFDFRIGLSWFLPPRSHPDAWRGAIDRGTRFAADPRQFRRGGGDAGGRGDDPVAGVG